ncbi:MAG: endonuclease/exonuclease/phosphatase (EEP) superfamily protein YafD [Paraglaciecola sp.]|jgi:endonuclease/exonuclease/phosphatase (EEP) superfamily protein YafD
MQTGWGQIYVRGLPHFRLDYIFYSDNIKLLKYEKIEVAISDHYPIFVTAQVF